MIPPTLYHDPDSFSSALFKIMKRVSPAVQDMELYEFRYALNNLYPEPGGWAAIQPDTCADLEARIADPAFYEAVQIKPRTGNRIVLDESIVQLTRMLFVGLVNGCYPLEWVHRHFYFDPRGFFFLTRTPYFTEAVLAHFEGKPYRTFTPLQRKFERVQDIGYKAFKAANAEVDAFFINLVQKCIAVQGTPILLAIAGPTAAGKTEIVDRLRETLTLTGKTISSIEMDNFLTDREYREEKGIHSFGKAAIHYNLFKNSLEAIARGDKIEIPRYDFVYATSSHDLNGHLKPDGIPIVIEPADIIFIEGNFPFLLPEIAQLIGVKIVYLTDDPIRLKRKWKRDVDYRKKYDPSYLRNRFFRDQFLMAQRCLRPQMEVCDILVDTTGARLWVTRKLIERVT